MHPDPISHNNNQPQLHEFLCGCFHRFLRWGWSMCFWLLCRKVASVARKTRVSSSRATSSSSFSCWALIGYNANKRDCHSIYPQPASVRPCQSSLCKTIREIQLVFRRISCPLPLACASRLLLHVLNLFASLSVLPYALTALEHR